MSSAKFIKKEKLPVQFLKNLLPDKIFHSLIRELLPDTKILVGLLSWKTDSKNVKHFLCKRKKYAITEIATLRLWIFCVILKSLLHFYHNFAVILIQS